MGSIRVACLGLYPILSQSNLPPIPLLTYCCQAAKDLWDSYDLITKFLLDFDYVGSRIKYLEKSADQELPLLSPVYLQMFRLMLKFVGILTRYVRDKEFGTQKVELTNS